MNSRTNAMRNWDFSIPEELVKLEDWLEFMKTDCKYWNFQKELSKSKYLHWQIRVNLHTKIRRCDLVKQMKHFGAAGSVKPTSTPCWHSVSKHRFYEYCQKDRTRVAGPWRDDTDTEWFPPSWIENAKHLYPFQTTIYDSCGPNRDKVFVIYNPDGMSGKTETMGILKVLGKKVYTINPSEKPDRMIYTLANELINKKDRTPDLIILDIPKGFHNKAAWASMIALEQLTSQEITDSRHKSTSWRFVCPSRWVFTNQDPVVWKNNMSEGRWVIYEMQSDRSIVRRC